MEEKKKTTLEELIDVAPEETELEKENPDKLDLEEPQKRVWLRILVWFGIFMTFMAGLGYTGYQVYTSNFREESVENKIQGSVVTETPQDSTKYVYVDAEDGLNLRASASADGAVVVLLPNKAKLLVVSEGAEWYNVTYEGQTGYVAASYVTTSIPAAE